MKLLAIDTSTQNLSLAISDDDKVLRYQNGKLRRPLSSSIISGIRAILKRAGITLKAIDGFAVGLGPGSFTSLRVGLSTVKGLAFALQKPVVGISSLDILAMNVVSDHNQICVMTDARRKMVYGCLYEKQNGVLKRRGDYRLAEAGDFLKGITGETAFIGDGVGLYAEAIIQAKGLEPVIMPEKYNQPQARYLAPMALTRFRDGAVDDINTLIPLYLYPDDCQIRR